MKPTRIRGSSRLFCALMLVLVLSLASATAHGAMISGSIVVSAYWTELEFGTDLSSSNIFTPWGPTPTGIGSGGMYMVGGDGDFSAVPYTLVSAAPLDITDGTSWTFTTSKGTWTTSSFENVDPSTGANGYLDFLLKGTFTPAGSLSGFDATPAEMRISLNKTGSVVSWAGTMTMIPEPATMSLLGFGGLIMIIRRRRK